MSAVDSPRRVGTNFDSTSKRPINSVLNVRRQHPALARVLSKSEVQPSDATSIQLFHQAEVLLTDIGYKDGKVLPKLLTKTPERPRCNIRAPGPSVVPHLNLEAFNPDTDSTLKIPMRTATFQEKPQSSFREVPRPPKREPISLRPSRPDTHRSGRPSVSQLKSRTLRETMQLQEMSPNERAILRKKSEEQKKLLSSHLRASLSRKLSRSKRLGIFSKQVNQVREDTMFNLVMTEKMKSEVSPAIRSMRDKMVEKRMERIASRRLETDQEADSSPSSSHRNFAQHLEKSLIDSRWRVEKKDYFFEHDPEEILGRFKWFSTERVHQLIPSREITQMPTETIKTTR